MKKKLSRIAAMLLAVVMVITGIAVMPSSDVKAADKPTFTVKTDVTEMKPGDKVHVEVWLDAGTNVMQIVGPFNFDTNVYTYVENSLVANMTLMANAMMNNGMYIIDSSDVYTEGGFSVLFDSGNVPIQGDVKLFEFDVTVNEDAVGSGLMEFVCSDAQTGTSDEDRHDVKDCVSKTVDANGNVIEGGIIPVIIELEGLAINQDDFTMARGEKDTLTVSATPEAALAGKTVTWSSTDDSVVKVDQEGNIEAVGVGTATITASCEEFSDSVTITVNAPLTGITLNTQETSIKKGDTTDLDVIYNPEDTTDDKKVTWTSSDDKIATVDENGVVTAVADGTATITATVGSLTAECIVHVREVPLEGIDLDKTAITMNKGEKSEALKVSYNPEDTTDDKTVTWSSENEDVATVENGVVTAVGAGTTTITATVGEFTAECEVTVVSPLESITLTADRTTDNLEVGDTVNLTVGYNPEDTTDKKAVTWSSSDEDVATVDENGVVTAVAGGTATITATSVANENITATCDIKVLKHTTGISLDKNEMELAKGETSAPLAVTFDPADTDDSKDLTWTSSDDTVATVDENGVVTAVGAGSATIRATLNANEDIYAECAVTVSVPLESITLTADKETDSLEVGDTVNLTVGYNPEDTTVTREVVWTSSDDTVATVDNGIVTAVGGGTATITATVNGISATCDVRVLKHTEGISLGTTEMNLMKGDVSDPIAVTFNPADTDDSKEVTWSSDNTAVAAVDSEGRVTAIGEGTAVITATAVDGGFTASCTVTVKEIHVEDAVLAEDTPSELYIGQNHTISVVITPENVTDEVTYSYASSDADVAAVDENGVVSALKAGTATITVTVTAGDFIKELSFDVEVKEIPLEGIAFKEEIKTLEEGQSAQLEILYNPENTTVDRTVTWNSSDPTVATVENGLVKALKAGTTVITATVGEKEISYELTVTEKQVTEPGTPSTENPQNPGTGKPSTGGAQNSGDKVNNQNNGGAVQTGDTFNVFGIMLTMLLSLSVALVVVFKSRAKRILK